jgi:uncharacterized OB-fold protein
VTGVLVSVCPSCGWRGFPQRLWCPSCGAERLEEAEVHAGLVEDGTVLQRAAGRELDGPVRLGTVLLDGEQVTVGVEDGVLVARREH